MNFLIENWVALVSTISIPLAWIFGGNFGVSIVSSGVGILNNDTNRYSNFDNQGLTHSDIDSGKNLLIKFPDSVLGTNKIINVKDESGTVALLSDITGATATQNARATRLELTSDINLGVSPTGSVSVIDFDNTIFNVDPTAFTNNGAGTITCTLAGNYLITTSVVIESPLLSAITKTELGIRKNGSAIVCASTDDTAIALGQNVRSLTTSTIINLSANDTIQAVVNLFGTSATGRALRLPALFGTTATQVSNISIERLEVSEFEVDATIIDGSANAVSGNAVFDGLALKQDALSYTPYRFVDATQATYLGSVIGLAETSVAQTTILGGTFNSSDLMKILFKVTKSTTSAGVNMRIRVNTTNNLGTATQIGILTLGAASTYSLMNRNINLFGGNAYNYNSASTLASDILLTNTAGTSFTYNTANDLYVFFTIQLGNALDSATFQFANITN